jgi:hypothetical protein
MAGNLYTFVADIENKLIAPDEFYKGLFNLYNHLLETSGIPPENQLPSYLGNGRDALGSACRSDQLPSRVYSSRRPLLAILSRLVSFG